MHYVDAWMFSLLLRTESAQMIAVEVPVLFAKACEVMTREITQRSYAVAKENKRRTLSVPPVPLPLHRHSCFSSSPSCRALTLSLAVTLPFSHSLSHSLSLSLFCLRLPALSLSHSPTHSRSRPRNLTLCLAVPRTPPILSHALTPSLSSHALFLASNTCRSSCFLLALCKLFAL
jgi:hypothetical protein